jgi:peptidoglycan/LPS O-acetylase OafA/YrhL
MSTWREKGGDIDIPNLSSESTIKLHNSESKFTNQIKNEETPLLAPKTKHSSFGSNIGSKSIDNSNQLPRTSRTNSRDSIESQPYYAVTFTKDVIDFFLYGPKPMSKEELKKREWHWYDIWDIGANSSEIFIRHRESDLAVLDGIRALAYLWVLSDHVEQAFTKEVDGFVDWWHTQSDGIGIVADGNKGDQGVTSFFFLSGFLIPFIFSKMIISCKKSLPAETPAPAFSYHAFEFLFRRYMRLGPVLMAGTVVAVLYGYNIHAYSAISYKSFYSSCSKYWWENALFINNISGIAGWGDCYDSVWTISVEYQLYILTIPIVFFHDWKKEYGWTAVAIWTSLTFAIRILMTYFCDTNSNLSYTSYVYLTPWCRAPEYGVGMAMFMLYEHYYETPKKKAQIIPFKDLNSRQVLNRILFYGGVFGIFAFGLFYLLVENYEDWWSYSYAQYESFSYFIWGSTLLAVVFLSIDSINGIWLLWPLRWFLSWYVWYPIAQVAYTAGVLNMVICHGVAVMTVVIYGDEAWSIDTPTITYLMVYMLIALLTLTCGLGLSLLVERPAMNLAKKVPPFYVLFGPSKEISAV